MLLTSPSLKLSLHLAEAVFSSPQKVPMCHVRLLEGIFLLFHSDLVNVLRFNNFNLIIKLVKEICPSVQWKCFGTTTWFRVPLIACRQWLFYFESLICACILPNGFTTSADSSVCFTSYVCLSFALLPDRPLLSSPTVLSIKRVFSSQSSSPFSFPSCSDYV